MLHSTINALKRAAYARAVSIPIRGEYGDGSLRSLLGVTVVLGGAYSRYLAKRVGTAAIFRKPEAASGAQGS